MENNFCIECLKYPLKYSKFKCVICDTLCCCHKCKRYENIEERDDELSKIDFYWYSIEICDICIIKILTSRNLSVIPENQEII